MHSLNEIILTLNKQLSGLSQKGKYFNVCQSVTRDNDLFPYDPLTQKSVAIDDLVPVMTWHKQNSITSTILPGYGDSIGITQNIYQNSLICFADLGKLNISLDDLIVHVEGINGILKVARYADVRVTQIILNDTQVWRQEFGQSPFRLFPNQRLIQINYQVTVKHSQQCIKPTCKN